MTPEERKEYNKQYRIKNKERTKEYLLKNKEYITEQKKEYQQTPNGVKSSSIRRWKYRGVIHEDFDKLYELYINTEECNVCHNSFKSTIDRCLDHSHITGEFRQILCQKCNNRDSWKNKI